MAMLSLIHSHRFSTLGYKFAYFPHNLTTSLTPLPLPCFANSMASNTPSRPGLQTLGGCTFNFPSP